MPHTLNITQSNVEALKEAFECARGGEKQRIRAILWNRYQEPIYKVWNWCNESGDPYVEYLGYDLEQGRHELATAGQIDDYKHRKQTWTLFSATADGEEIEVIDARTIPPINDATDDILNEVIRHFGGKYTTWDAEDGENVKLRIADHSGKHKNNAGDKCISIVIANDNTTAHFRSKGPEGISNEHYYNDEHTAEEIIAEIIELLEWEGVSVNEINTNA